MRKIDSSLCSNCIHTKNCTLTESKRFIWSCSEFEVNELKQEAKTKNGKLELSLI